MKLPSSAEFQQLIIRKPSTYLKLPKMGEPDFYVRTMSWKIRLRSLFQLLFVHSELIHKDIAGAVIIGSAIARKWFWKSKVPELDRFDPHQSKSVIPPHDLDIAIVTTRPFESALNLAKIVQVGWRFGDHAYEGWTVRLFGNLHVIGVSETNVDSFGNEIKTYGSLVFGSADSIESAIGVRPATEVRWRRGFPLIGSPHCVVTPRLRLEPNNA